MLECLQLAKKWGGTVFGLYLSLITIIRKEREEGLKFQVKGFF